MLANFSDEARLEVPRWTTEVASIHMGLIHKHKLRNKNGGNGTAEGFSKCLDSQGVPPPRHQDESESTTL